MLCCVPFTRSVQVQLYFQMWKCSLQPVNCCLSVFDSGKITEKQILQFPERKHRLITSFVIRLFFFLKSTIKTSSTLNLFPLEQTINTDLSLCRAIIPLSVTFPHDTTSIMYKLSCRFSMEVSLSRQASSM